MAAWHRLMSDEDVDSGPHAACWLLLPMHDRSQDIIHAPANRCAPADAGAGMQHMPAMAGMAVRSVTADAG
jgi:hypothetical protein